jgi:hypothetical protein
MREVIMAPESRICISCGKKHNTGLENTHTGDFKPWDKCYDCVMSNGYHWNITKEQVVLNIDEDKHD